MNAEIFVEKFNRIFVQEIHLILEQNYKETAQFDEPLDIDWEAYLSAGDNMVAFVMRNEGSEIVGLLIFHLGWYPHIKTLIVAQQVTFYVMPEYRRHSLKLLKFSENYLKEHDIDIIVQSARCDSEFCNVLDAKGYARTDVTFTKRLT